MSTSGPDDTPPQPPDELGGLDPKDLFNAGLESVPPVTLPPQPVDPDATIRVSQPTSAIAIKTRPELPLPEELTAILPPGSYQVEKFLGQGGMGAVYKGMQVRLKRPVAIKIMRRDFGQDHDFEARFEREAQAMAKLNHPNIVSVIDFGEAGPDYLYIVMELVDGADIMDVIRTGRMTQEMALTLLPQICDALQFAHDHGIVHRDIKPSNIMLTRDGRIKMADFGLAKRFDAESSFRTQTGTGMGTPDYAAPEQFDPNAQIDHRADIYALGVMIYQMITGQLPRGVWKPPSQRAEVAPQWDDIVGRAMQSDPADRYQKATEVKTDVSSISLTPVAQVSDLGGTKPSSAKSTTQPSATPPASVRRATTNSRAPRLVGIAATALVLGIVAFFALRDTAPRSGGLQPPSQATAITPGSSPGSAQQTPTPAVPNTPLLAQPLPESGWKPLFTETEWRSGGDGREFKDGLLHVRTGWTREQPAVDGAIRTKLRYQGGTKGAGVVMRSAKTRLPSYQLSMGSTGADVFLIHHYASGSSGNENLARASLPKPLQPGDFITLELRVQGNRIVGLANGQLVGDVRHEKLTESGEWGIYAEDAWFESVEVQPLPAASPTPKPPASKSSDPKFPPGQWVKLFTKPEDVTADQRRFGMTYKEGWLVGGLSSLRISLPDSLTHNYGVRASCRLSTKRAGSRVAELTRLSVRRTPGGTQHQVGLTGDLANWVHQKGKTTLSLTGEILSAVPKLEENAIYRLELAAIGSRLITRFNDTILKTADLSDAPEGTGAILGSEDLRDIEVINLDGLPEAEALRLLGVDEKGNDLRGKAASASPSPNLPVSKSSDPKFPPGQWVQPFKDITDINDTWIKAGVTWSDGWITPGEGNNNSVTLSALNGRGKNWGVRARYRWQDKGAATLLLRRDGKAADNSQTSYQFKVDASGAAFAYAQGNGARPGSTISALGASSAVMLTSNSEVVIEAFAIGKKIYGRVNGQIFQTPTDGKLAEGAVEAASRQMSYRDIEFINLDGLPEAEALRLLGVDEKGNDLLGKQSSDGSSGASQQPAPAGK